MKARFLTPVVAAGAAVALFGGMSLAATSSSQVLLQSRLYGNIPGVTIRGVAAPPAPWVVDGQVTLTRKHLTISGTWLVIPAGYLGSGGAVPKTLVGTTAKVPKVVADITTAKGTSLVTAPVTLSKTGAFSFSVPVNLTGPIEYPVVLIGPPGKTAHSIGSWFASSNFLTNYGVATPQMIKSWTAPTKGSTGGSSGGSYGSPKKGSSSSSSSGW